MFLILDKDGRTVGLASAQPNLDELAERGERVLPEAELSLVQKRAVAAIGRVTPQLLAAAQPRLELSTTAEDTDGDGVAEIPADGESRATLAVKGLTAAGKAMSGKRAVRLRTTGGALSDRTIRLDDGAAEFSLVASRDTVVVTVSAESEGAAPATLPIEFIPVAKAKTPARSRK